jgi:hypothetical protein
MVKRYEFIERTLYLVRKILSENLPDEATLEEMTNKLEELITKIYE